MEYPALSGSSLASAEAVRLDQMLAALWHEGRRYTTAPALAERFGLQRYEAAELLLAAAAARVVRRLDEHRCPDCDGVALLALDPDDVPVEDVLCPYCGKRFRTGPATRWTGFWLRPPTV